MASLNYLLTEKLRPTSFDKMLLLPRIKSELDKGLTQNIILYSSTPGSGKSTSARILCQGHQTLRLNGSSENGVDVIRNKVVQFASTMSLEDSLSSIKVVYIDEADGLSDAAWDALRETIEHYAGSVRFVCTCNKIDKIPSPIKSRFNCIPFYPQNREEEDFLMDMYIERVGKLLQAFNITYEQETLVEFVKLYFPDMRSILNTIQSLMVQDATVLDKNTFVKTMDCADLFDLITSAPDPVANYKFIMENYTNNPDDVLRAISKGFVDYIKASKPNLEPKIPYVIITTAEYMYQLTTAPDKVLVVLACCFKLQSIMNQTI